MEDGFHGLEDDLYFLNCEAMSVIGSYLQLTFYSGQCLWETRTSSDD